MSTPNLDYANLDTRYATPTSVSSAIAAAGSTQYIYPAGFTKADLDTAAAAAVAANKPLYLPPGTYCDGTARLDLPAGLQMLGAGKDKTIIATNILIRSNQLFSDFTVGVDGQRSAFDTTTTGARYIRVKFSKGHASQGNLYNISASASDILFYDCEFCNNTLGGNGVQLVDKGTAGVHLEGITFFRCRYYNNSRMNFEIVQRSDSGQVVLGYRRIDHIECTFDPPTNTSGQNMGLSYDSEYLQDSSLVSTGVPSSGYSRIENCTIRGGGYCIELAASTHMVVKGNKIYGGTATGGTGRLLSTSGINYADAYHQITGNQFYGTLTAHNVVFQGGRNNIQNNDIETPGYMQFLRANNSIFKGNQVVTTGTNCFLGEDTYDNIIEGNKFYGGTVYTIRLSDPDSHDDVFRNNDITAPTLDFSIQAGILRTVIKGNRTRTAQGALWAASSFDTEGAGSGSSVDTSVFMQVVRAADNASAARPTAPAVYWVMNSGITPVNAVYPDIIFNTPGTLTTVGTPPAAFTPSAISGLTHDLDADAISGTDGTAVATWANAGTVGGSAAQATSGFQPLLKVGTFNGHNAVRFDGTDDRLAFTNQSVGPEYTVIVVSDLNGFSGSAALVGADSTTSPNRIFQFKFSSSSLLTLTAFTGGTGSDTSKVFSGSAHLTPTFSTATRSSTDVNVYHRTNAPQTSTLAAGNSTSTLALTIGSNVNGTNPANGDIARVLIWNRVLSSSELTQAWSYITARYGIAAT